MYGSLYDRVKRGGYNNNKNSTNEYGYLNDSRVEKSTFTNYAKAYRVMSPYEAEKTIEAQELQPPLSSKKKKKKTKEKKWLSETSDHSVDFRTNSRSQDEDNVIVKFYLEEQQFKGFRDTWVRQDRANENEDATQYHTERLTRPNEDGEEESVGRLGGSRSDGPVNFGVSSEDFEKFNDMILKAKIVNRYK